MSMTSPKSEDKQFFNADGTVRQDVTGMRHSDHRMGLGWLGCFEDKN